MIEREDDLTLQEIEALSGVAIRTLRSWIDEGLLEPPDKSGRGARYPRENVDRALAVLTLKAQKLSLKEIAQMFILASPSDLQTWAADAPKPNPAASAITDYLRNNVSEATRGAPVKSKSLFDLDDPDVSSSTLSEKHGYQSRNQMKASSRADKPRMSSRARREEEITAIEDLIPELERILGSVKPPRRVRSEPWIRLPVTFGFELSVRGDLSPRERHVFEQFAGELRALFRRRDQDERTELYPGGRR